VLRQSLSFNMVTFRSFLFWAHLACGVAAGVVVLLMSVTGVALTYEKQMLEWADARAHSWVPPPEGARPLPPETLLAAVVAARPGVPPTGVTRRAHPAAPVTVTFEGNRALLVNPYTGAVLGEPAAGLRAFFRTTTNWHRWLALDGVSRATGRLVTGVSNLLFLFIVVSGIYLWVPRMWTRLQFAHVLWFRRGLPGKARDFNWHNVIGIWSALPLAVVVAGAVPISFPWASNLVYRLAGDTPPAPARPVASGGNAAAERGRAGRAPGAPVSFAGLDAAWATAESRVPEWRAVSARWAGAADAPLILTVDAGYGGQPQKRGTLTVDRATGAVRSWETFDALSPGRRARSWLRFAHTGEYYGLAGQTVAGLVSAGGAVLVYTGLALAWRRFVAWLRRWTEVRDRALVTTERPRATTPRS
jgi:uncharacterized iron-regulated membrane protein